MSKEFIDKYMEETNEIIRDIDRASIDKAISMLFEAWKSGKKIFTIGNGGSASTASHFAADLSKTISNSSSDKEVIEGKKALQAFCLSDNPALLTAWTNDSGWEHAYDGQLNNLLQDGDIILLLSVHGGSGWSGNIVRAMETAKKKNAKIIGFAGFDGGMVKKLADVSIIVPKDSTPHTEGFHSVLQHLIVSCLKEMVDNSFRNQAVIKLEEAKQLSQNDSIKAKLDNIIKEYSKPE